MSSTTYIEELANYIGCLKVSEIGRLAMVNKAIYGPEGEWFLN